MRRLVRVRLSAGPCAPKATASRESTSATCETPDLLAEKRLETCTSTDVSSGRNKCTRQSLRPRPALQQADNLGRSRSPKKRRDPRLTSARVRATPRRRGWRCEWCPILPRSAEDEERCHTAPRSRHERPRATLMLQKFFVLLAQPPHRTVQAQDFASQRAAGRHGRCWRKVTLRQLEAP